MTDRFQNYADLSAEMLRDDDYQIRAEDRGSAVIIIAPHGGTIEPETSLIAEAIAGSDYSYYLFEALKAGAHGDFHITSHRFDEPQAWRSMAARMMAPKRSGLVGVPRRYLMPSARLYGRRGLTRRPIPRCPVCMSRTSATEPAQAKAFS